MPWWEDITNLNSDSLLNKTTTNENLSKSIDELNKTELEVDTSPISNVNTDLSNIASGIVDTADKGISQSLLTGISSLRPENQYQQNLTESLGLLKDYTTGDSKADRTAANIALSKFDTSSAAANISQAQRIASNPNLTVGAKQAAMSELNRATGSQRSQLAGQLAQQAQERAFTATQKYVDAAQVAAQFEEGKFEFDMKVAGEETSKRLQARIAAGELTQAQAAMELEQANNIVTASVQNKRMELDKNIAAVESAIKEASLSMEESKLDLEKINLLNTIKNDAIKLSMEQQSYTGSSAANLVMGLYDQNPNLTASDVMNNKASMQAMTNYHQSIPGNNGIPTEDDIAAYMTQMKPEWLVTKETFNRNMDTMVTSLRNVGADQNTIDTVSNIYSVIDATGGAIIPTDEGVLSFVGADGTPMTYINEYGEETPLTFGGVQKSNVKQGLSRIFSEDNLNTYIDDIYANRYDSASAFINKIKLDAKKNNVSIEINEDDLKEFYKDAKSGKVAPTKNTLVQTTNEEEIQKTKELESIRDLYTTRANIGETPPESNPYPSLMTDDEWSAFREEMKTTADEINAAGKVEGGGTIWDSITHRLGF